MMESDVLELLERIAMSYRVVIFCAGGPWICEIGESEEWSARADTIGEAIFQAAQRAGYPVPSSVPIG